MFALRQNFADNGEINRQTIIQQVILFGKRPQTTLEKMAAAIYGNRYIDVLFQAKIAKYIDDIMGYVDARTHADCQNALKRKSVRQRVRQYVEMLRLDIGDPIYLNRNIPILSVQPEKPEVHRFMLETTTSNISTIAEFEFMTFNNIRKYRYLGGTTFAGYIFQNILYSLNAQNVEALVDNESWQARLALLLHNTDLNDRVARTVFYENVVRYKGIDYDCSFVPKYDVNSLMPQQPPDSIATHLEMIRYRNSIDIVRTKQIPPNYMAIFRVFPFMHGHYIKPNGRVVFLNVSAQCRKSVRLTINDLCHSQDLEYTVESAARNLTLDDVIYFAIYAETIKEQALALLVLRCMIGSYVTIQKHSIRLPQALTILSWTKLSCNSLDTIILPPPYRNIPQQKIQMYTSLIKDIAKSCYSKMNAVIICGSYNLPEYILKPCYDNLQNDAEKYIFFTLLLQDYNYASYSNARNRLRPVFGQETCDLSQYEMSTNTYNDSTLADRLNALTEPLVKPANMNDVTITACPPYKCVDMYEFVDPQLQTLVKTESCQLTAHQFANYIALVLN